MNYENVNCDYCGSNDYIVVSSQTDLLYKTTKDIFYVVKCKSCNLHFTNPRPDSSSIGKFYVTNYSFHNSRNSIKYLLDIILNWIANSYLVLIFNPLSFLNSYLIQRIKPNIKDPILIKIKNSRNSGRQKILDIGCGSGTNAHFFGIKGSLNYYKRYAEVYGCEFAEAARKNLNKLNIICYSSINFIPDNEKFDIIRMNWSLEHVDKPSNYFKFMKEHLTENGIAIVCVPNNEGHVYQHYPDCLELPIHFYHFSIKDICNYSKKFDLKIKDIKTFSYPGLYYFSSKFYPSLREYQSLSIIKAWKMNKALNESQKENGNDMIFVLSH